MHKSQSSSISHNLILPEELRDELKEPLGELITKEPSQELIRRYKKEKPPLVILVGDFCVNDALKSGFIADIAIIDRINLRKPYEEISIHNAKVIKIKNPPAVITVKSWKQIRKAIKQQQRSKKKPLVLMVEGEEDLLVLPAVIEAPEGSFVVYGQPYEGIVLIKVTANTKFKCMKFIERMKVERNENQNSREKN